MARIDKSMFLVYMLLTFLSGSAVATFVPVMSLYLTEQVNATSLEVGIYFTTASIMGIVITQFIAKLSDGKLSRNKLVLLASVAGMCVALTYIFLPYYYVILTLGVLCLSVSNVGTPQIFASGREYGIAQFGNSLMFTSYMRSFFAFAWVITPPLAFMIAVSYGYSHLFYVTLVTFFIQAMIAKFWMPETSLPTVTDNTVTDKKTTDNMPVANDRIWGNRDVLLLFVAVTLMWTCNNLYLISMPIFIKNELQLGATQGAIYEYLPGIMMATAALLEIPMMLYGSHLAKRTGLKPLMVFSAISGVIFYLSLILVGKGTATSFISIQIFNAIFIGILACLGMVYFQELLPSIPGQATTLFNNAVATGAIVSGALVAAVAHFGSYSYAFALSLCLTFVAFIMLFFVKKV